MSLLPDDLARLGAELEAATARSVRRRARRQAIVDGAAAVLIAVPLAIAVSAAELAPDVRHTPPPSATPGAPLEPLRTVRTVHHEAPPCTRACAPPAFVPAGRT